MNLNFMSKIPNPTIYDVAEAAGVSIATVSRVLNGSSKVRDITRRKVMEAVDKLGFVPKADAVARAKSSYGQIGIISPFFTIPSFGQRMRGVAKGLANSPYELIIYTVDSLNRYESFLAQVTLNTQLEGLIINALPLDDASARRLKASQLETVLIEYTHPNFCNLQIDNEHGGRLAAQHLLSKGHRNFGFMDYFVPDDHAIRPGNARLRGFKQTIEDAGASLADDNIIFTPINNVKQNRAGIETLINNINRPTALFVVADYLAIYVMQVIQQSSLKIPDDIAIIGFDDLELAEMMGLTTVSQSLDETGQLAAELLLSRIEKENAPLQSITIQLHVVERETT